MFMSFQWQQTSSRPRSKRVCAECLLVVVLLSLFLTLTSFVFISLFLTHTHTHTHTLSLSLSLSLNLQNVLQRKVRALLARGQCERAYLWAVHHHAAGRGADMSAIPHLKVREGEITFKWRWINQNRKKHKNDAVILLCGANMSCTY